MPTPASGLCHRTCGAKFCAPCGTPRCGVFVSFTLAAEDGGPCVASATGPPRSGFHGVAHRATSSCFNGLPTGSLRHMPQPGKRHADGVTHRCGLRPPQRPEPCFALVLGLLILHTRARKAREAVSVLVHGPSFYSPAHRPSDPARFRVFLSSRAKRGRKQTPHRAPGEAARCRHVAHAPGSRCLRPCKPAGLCAVSSCRRFSDPRPARHPWPDPDRLSTGSPLCGNPVQRRSPRIGRECRLCSGPGIRFAGYPAHHSSQHSAEETPDFPATPRRISAAIPKNGICRQKTDPPYETPCSSPREEPHDECPRISPPDVPNAALSARRKRSTRTPARFTVPDSSAAPSTRGHTRRRASPRARGSGCHGTLCRGQTDLWTPRRPTSCPPKIGTPGLSAPERKARSQKPDVRPRKLRLSSGLSLRATRLAAASRLSRSCHRPRGPVAHPRSGWPARRSRHPAALWAGRCLTLRIHSRSSSSKVCATRTSFIVPPWTLSPPRGRVRRFCSGAAARAGERLQNKAKEVSPDPSYSAREACRRRNPPQALP